MTLLSIEKLNLSFGENQVIKDVSLTLAKGEMLALVGESGSGKSLTALSVMGLQPNAAKISGDITFDGQSIVGTSEASLRLIRGTRVSMIFQEPMTALNPLHTIGKQITEMFANHESSNHRIIALLDQVGLSHFNDRLGSYPHQLSGGERQRVMIAIAIANNPDLLIADEPTTAVDVTIQAKILKLLKELQVLRDMAMLFITHDLTVVKRLADRVAVMKNGEIVEQGKVSDIFANPKHPYTQKLLASEPKGSPLPPPANAKEIVSCESLKVYFPIKKGILRRTVGFVKAVDDITITIPEQSTLGIVGESGSGKTTLGMALLRLVKSDGKIVFSPSPSLSQKERRGAGLRLDQLSGANLQRLRKDMQLVFQDPYSSLNPRMSIEQIIGEGLAVHYPHMNRAEKAAAIEKILLEVGLSADIRHRFAHEFSGGQRQRISIARAMILKPAFVVLDEPTSALDLTIQTQIIDLLKDFQQKQGLAYAFISHDLRVVRAISHQIAVMHKGKIVEYGDTKSIFENPKQDYTKALIDAAFLK